MHSSTVPLIRKLALSDLCKSLTDKQVEEIFDLTEEKAVRKNHFVFKEGELADSLLVLVDGEVAVIKSERLLAKLGTGAVLGEVSLFGVQHQRTASIRALTDVHLLRIPSRTFRSLLTSENIAALKVVANLAHQLCQRLLAANEQLIAAVTPSEKRDEEILGKSITLRIGW